MCVFIKCESLGTRLLSVHDLLWNATAKLSVTRVTSLACKFGGKSIISRALQMATTGSSPDTRPTQS